MKWHICYLGLGIKEGNLNMKISVQVIYFVGDPWKCQQVIGKMRHEGILSNRDMIIQVILYNLQVGNCITVGNWR